MIYGYLLIRSLGSCRRVDVSLDREPKRLIVSDGLRRRGNLVWQQMQPRLCRSTRDDDDVQRREITRAWPDLPKKTRRFFVLMFGMEHPQITAQNLGKHGCKVPPPSEVNQGLHTVP
jgi:hypothetical protein